MFWCHSRGNLPKIPLIQKGIFDLKRVSAYNQTYSIYMPCQPDILKRLRTTVEHVAEFKQPNLTYYTEVTTYFAAADK